MSLKVVCATLLSNKLLNNFCINLTKTQIVWAKVRDFVISCHSTPSIKSNICCHCVTVADSHPFHDRGQQTGLWRLQIGWKNISFTNTHTFFHSLKQCRLGLLTFLGVLYQLGSLQLAVSLFLVPLVFGKNALQRQSSENCNTHAAAFILYLDPH